MIERILAPERANAIYGEGDLTQFVVDQRNVILADGEDLAVFVWRGPGIYEGHLKFVSRGRGAIRVGKAMIAEMPKYGARMIWGPTPVGLRHVRWFQRQLGFVSHGVIDTPEGQCELFVMEGLCP